VSIQSHDANGHDPAEWRAGRVTTCTCGAYWDGDLSVPHAVGCPVAAYKPEHQPPVLAMPSDVPDLYAMRSTYGDGTFPR
jgi:hypothetical protein